MSGPLLHVQEFGAGPAVVLLHGLFGSADNWRPIAVRLAERFHVLVIDQRNHGASPHHAEMDYPLMAADVAGLLAARGVTRVRVVGHSMGGKTAMQLALQCPECVERLVVADIAPREYAPHLEPLVRALRALDLARYQTRQQIEDALEPAIPDLSLRRFLLKNLGRDGAGRFAWKINLRGIADNYARLCEPLDGPQPYCGAALFLRAGQSDYISGADESRIRELFPAAQIHTMPGVGHWIHAEQPEEFLRLVLDFFH